jgi:hypothetical protein
MPRSLRRSASAGSAARCAKAQQTQWQFEPRHAYDLHGCSKLARQTVDTSIVAELCVPCSSKVFIALDVVSINPLYADPCAGVLSDFHAALQLLDDQSWDDDDAGMDSSSSTQSPRLSKRTPSEDDLDALIDGARVALGATATRWEGGDEGTDPEVAQSIAARVEGLLLPDIT